LSFTRLVELGVLHFPIRRRHPRYRDRAPRVDFGTRLAFGIIHLVTVILNDAEARVLAALVEKEITTPNYYPLSLNALANACNQKSNREPVMSLDEDTIRRALHSLDEQCLVRAVTAADSRVTKYEHRFQEAFNFTRPETAIICQLLLRGPQTPGELRSRAERMHHFDDLSVVQSTLQRLMTRDPALVKALPRQPGTKEVRYAHLLAGDVEGGSVTVASPAPPPLAAATVSRPSGSISDERIARLEEEIANVRAELADVRQQLAAFQKQFQ
jgi:uncharacterized protein